MEIIQSAPAAEPEIKSMAHGIQRDRQAYLARLIENTTLKMELLRQEADADVESDQTFQSWLADQIFESANQLTLQFTEAVITRTWEKIQGYKLDQVKAMVKPVGRDAATRAQTRSSAEAVLRQVERMKENMGNLMN